MVQFICFMRSITAEKQGGLGGQSGWADSNRRPPRPKRGALPAALHPERGEYNA